MKEIPKKIEICPIVDGVVELRFESNIFPNAVFGLIYNSLQKDFPKVEKLPILQLPEQLRDVDPNFKFKAHYKIVSPEGYSVQIGPDVLVLGCPMPYPGWDNYSKIIHLVFDKVFKLNVIQKVLRLGVRFINFFDLDIFEQINLDISINKEPHTPKNTMLRTQVEVDGVPNTLNVANNASQTINEETRTGSVIDIDTFKNYKDAEFKKIYKREIELAHKTEKQVFFSLLEKSFLQSLKPTYE